MDDIWIKLNALQGELDEMRRLISSKRGGRSIVNGLVAPPEAWAPTPSAELTAFEAFVGDTEGAQLYIFDGASNQRSFALLGGISSGAIGFAHNWLSPGAEAQGASATDTQRPSLLTTGGIVSAYFNGDRTTDAANSRLVLPHVTASQYITAMLVYLDREDAVAPEIAAQTNHWRIHTRDGLSGQLEPRVRTGNNVRTSFGGASVYQTWTLLLVITDRVAGRQWVRRGGGAWVEATLDPTTPWLQGSIYNQVSYLGRGGYTPSSGEPFKGAICAWAMVPKIPATANEEQAVIDMVLKGTGLSDASPGVPSYTPPTPPPGDASNAGTIGTASRTVNVATATQLSNALSAAEPGDHIVLANGNYSGTFTTSINGTSSQPIVIKSSSFLGGTILGRLVVPSNWNTVYGLNVTANGNNGNIQLSGDDCRILRNIITITSDTSNQLSGLNVVTGTKRYEIAYNEFNGGYFPARINPSTNMDGWFHHNHCHDSRGNGCEIGSSWSSANTQAGILQEYNLIERTGNNTAYGTKSGGVTYYRCTVKDCGRNTYMVCRHGLNVSFIANTIIETGGIFYRGGGGLILGNDRNYAEASAYTEMVAPTGDSRIATISSSNNNPSGDDCLWIANTPRVRIGGGSGSAAFLPNGNRVESPTSAWILVSGKHTNTTTTTALSRSVPARITLTPSMVGPLASPVGSSYSA